MPKGRVILLGALGVVGALEVVGIATDHDTVSALVADTFHTDTTTGRAIFTVAYVPAALWFLRHIWTFGRSVKNQGGDDHV